MRFVSARKNTIDDTISLTSLGFLFCYTLSCFNAKLPFFSFIRTLTAQKEFRNILELKLNNIQPLISLWRDRPSNIFSESFSVRRIS